MTQEEFALADIPVEKFALLSKDELIAYIKGEQRLRVQLQKEVENLRAFNDELKQRALLVEEQYINIKNKYFGKSSEREPSDELKSRQPEGPKRKRVQLPSERYPNAPLIERHIELQTLPTCDCCKAQMKDSGMTEDAEFLTVIPAQHIVVRQRRHKYTCSKCHGAVKTAPPPPRIKPGSSYSDEMMIDVACSKFCDLIPIERYSSIAGRAGLKDLPPQSLIETTHYLADFVRSAYEKLKFNILNLKVLNADETPHRMLEGSDKASWYLWGFSGSRTSYFEIHDTRSGNVASEILLKGKCEYLGSDKFSGYARAVRETNKVREVEERPKIKSFYCNAHARRKFKEAKDAFPDEAGWFIEQYKLIYKLNADAKEKPPDEVLRLRSEMKPIFDEMRVRAMANIAGYSSQSSIEKAMSYFFESFKELTLFIGDHRLAIDNNRQESLLRNPVIGRKTWYGTHSKRGAETTAVLFSLIESAKLCGVNPREYFKKLVEDLHQGKSAFTPSEFADLRT